VNGVEAGMVSTGFGIIPLDSLTNRGGIGGTIVQDVFVDNLLSPYDNFYLGLMDNVTYHNIALTPDQIQDIYNNNGDRTNMNAQSYTIKVYDSNGCVEETPLTISEPSPLVLDFTQQNVDCNGSNSGEINVTASGGTIPYRFNWAHGAFTEDLSSISAGTYNLTVVDDNNCEEYIEVVISEPELLEASITTNLVYNGYYISCNGSSDGSISASQNGGTGPFSYMWSEDNLTSQSISNLSSGMYTVTITDAENCSAVSSIELVDPPVLDIDLSVISLFNGQDISCAGGTDARIESSVNGGVAPYQYAWQNLTSNDDFLENIGAGKYIVAVTDANGCENIDSISVTEPSFLEVDLTIESNFNGFAVSCNGATDGSVSSIVTGGTGVYSYLWSSTNATTPGINNGGAGTHILTVQDENGCIAKDTVVLNSPSPIQFNVAASDLNDCGQNDGSINVGASGGVGTYEYRINGSPWQIEDNFQNLAPGTYTAFVRNTFGTCQVGPKTVVIDVPEAPLINNTIIVNPAVSTSNDGSVIVNASGSGNTTQLQYQLRGITSWQTSNVFSNLGEGIYTVDVRFSGQTCFSSSSIELIAGAGIIGSGQESSFCSDEINGAQFVETYFIPGPEDQILQSLNSIDCGLGGSSPIDPVQSYVSIGIVEDGVRIYYDQWENGYETNLAFPSQLFGANMMIIVCLTIVVPLLWLKMITLQLIFSLMEIIFLNLQKYYSVGIVIWLMVDYSWGQELLQQIEYRLI